MFFTCVTMYFNMKTFGANAYYTVQLPQIQVLAFIFKKLIEFNIE